LHSSRLFGRLNPSEKSAFAILAAGCLGAGVAALWLTFTLNPGVNGC
jgi:hypothetical protein